MKSVQTNDVDVDAKIGSTHCLTISVLAKASSMCFYLFINSWFQFFWKCKLVLRNSLQILNNSKEIYEMISALEFVCLS